MIVMRSENVRAGLLALVALCALPVHAVDVTNPAEVQELRVNPDAVPDDLVLSWDPVALDASGNAESVAEYRVYRGDTPDFVPDKDLGGNLVGTPAGTSFTDAGARTDGIDHYYLVSAVEGSTLTLICHLNKPVEQAWLTDEDGNKTGLTAAADNPTARRAAILLQQGCQRDQTQGEPESVFCDQPHADDRPRADTDQYEIDEKLKQLIHDHRRGGACVR